MSSTNAKSGALRRALEAARGEGVSMADLTVLALVNDPYRRDTPSGHRDGQWFAEQLSRALRDRPRIHLRGVHYAIVAAGDVLKPNGKPYKNSDADWTWLQQFPAKAARWLGYVPFTSIADERNDPPVIHRKDRTKPETYISVGIEVDIPDVDDLEPSVGVIGFEGRQPYHLVIFGEKSSLSDVVLPIARRFDADVYLPTGEITDTLLYQMAADGAADGRPMKVFTLSDCDPAGHQMPVSIGRKLQALRDLYFPDLDFEVRQVALTVEQVRVLGLPSTPLKETERRADRWRTAFGVEQTEIDALGTLQPDVLRRIVTDALVPFYDHDLDGRVSQAKLEWRARAQRMLDEQIDGAMVDRLRKEAAGKLALIEKEIDAINDKLQIATEGDLELPVVRIPGPDVDASLHSKPLVSSSWLWTEQTRSLIQHKTYGGNEE